MFWKVVTKAVIVEHLLDKYKEFIKRISTYTRVNHFENSDWPLRSWPMLQKFFAEFFLHPNFQNLDKWKIITYFDSYFKPCEVRYQRVRLQVPIFLWYIFHPLCSNLATNIAVHSCYISKQYINSHLFNKSDFILTIIPSPWKLKLLSTPRPETMLK